MEYLYLSVIDIGWSIVFISGCKIENHMHESTKEIVLTLMSEHLGVEYSELTDDAPLADMMDELDHIELILALEEAFGVELPDDPEEVIYGTVGQFLHFLDSYLS